MCCYHTVLFMFIPLTTCINIIIMSSNISEEFLRCKQLELRQSGTGGFPYCINRRTILECI